MERFERIILVLLGAIFLLEVIILGRSSRGSGASLRERRQKLYLDTSALMDARLMAFVQTGILNYEIIILRSVLHELQLLADGSDNVRRARARAGLDMAKELIRLDDASVTVFDDPRDPIGVDNRLLDIAKQNHATILTNDFNLKKLAEAEQIQAISLNELALILRNEHAPGDILTVQITAAGSGVNQGVGYMDDGTMVVVDRAKKLIGQKVEIELTRMNQASSGTIFFAHLHDKKAKRTPRIVKASKSAKTELDIRSASKNSSKRRKKMTAEDKLIATIEKQ